MYVIILRKVIVIYATFVCMFNFNKQLKTDSNTLTYRPVTVYQKALEDREGSCLWEGISPFKCCGQWPPTILNHTSEEKKKSLSKNLHLYSL